MEELLKKIK